MRFFVVSASFPHVSLDVLAQLSAMSTQPGGARPAENGAGLDLSHILGCRQAYVVLATCNRFELYVSVENSAPGLSELEHAHHVLSRIHELFVICIAKEEFVKLFDIFVAEEAATHLFETISGLHSAALGEQDISRQIRQAYRRSQQTGNVDRLLNMLFQKAFRISKEIAATTDFSKSGASLVQVALNAVAHRVGKALVIGTGSYAGVTVARLKELRVPEIYVYSPNSATRARRFAASHAIRYCSDVAVNSVLRTTDVIISCSGNLLPGFFSPARIEKIRGTCPSRRPVTFIDLALNNDFDAGLALLPNVSLMTLTDITTRAWGLSAALKEGKRWPQQQVQAIVRRACSEFTRSYNSCAGGVQLSRLKQKLLRQGLSAAEVHQELITAKESAAICPQRPY